MNSITSNSHLRSIYVVVSLWLMVMPTAFAKDQKQIDLIVFGDYVVTMSSDNKVIKDGAVAVSGNQIVAVASSKEILRSYKSDQTIDGKSRILMPGLINGHTHTAMTLFRGMSDDLTLMDWLNNFIFPMEGQFVDKEFVAIGTRLACWEMIKGGTTTFVDMYFYPDVISQEIVDCGLRAIVGSPSIDFPSPGFKGWDDSFDAAINYINRWQGKHERITPAFAPHAPYTVSPEHIKQVADKAQELDAPVTTHLAEAEAETIFIKDKYNRTPVSHVSNLGLFDNINLIAAHMVHPSNDDIAILAEKQVGVIHNPTSNLKLAAGISPVVDMLDKGIKVGLGTDGAASNNDLDLWEDMRLAALIHKVKEQDSTAIPALTALKMATSMGAEAIGMDGVAGQLKPGMRADMIQVSLDELRLLPLYDVISHLVYVVDSNDVVTTIVSGRILMQDKQILTINEKKLKTEVIKKSKQIAVALAQNK